MSICESCGGTFFPESLEDVLLYRSLRHEKMVTPEAWHMTETLRESLATFLPVADLAPDALSGTVSLFGLPRCEEETSRLQAQPSAD